MERIGTKIRTQRKKNGLTLKELAERVAISAITLQRIETGKTSPSVVLLSEIAQALNKPVSSFIEENYKPLIHIKRENQRRISNQTHIIESGDSIAYNARVEHSVTALEDMTFFSIYVEDDEL